ncbi:hypothetical protein [Paenibacillus maysiensis]|nr:hypothetical protein [Paenibacillus maysiensis]
MSASLVISWLKLQPVVPAQVQAAPEPISAPTEAVQTPVTTE